MQQGITTIDNYKKCLKSEQFKLMERFSNNFIKNNKGNLYWYSHRWISDPLHNWSRQYEYMFVYSEIQRFLKNRNNDSVSILDAGSGITFFPYYLCEKISRLKMDCCDYDRYLRNVYNKINKNLKHKNLKNNPGFINSDIRKLPFEENSFDIIYCISVLEHTDEFRKIIKEFKRVLKRDGLLILTFDISIDGIGDIPRKKVFGLVNGILKKFQPRDKRMDMKKEMALLDSDKILTTKFMKSWRKDLLSWRFSIVTFLKNLLRLRFEGHYFTNLACFCAGFKPKK